MDKIIDINEWNNDSKGSRVWILVLVMKCWSTWVTCRQSTDMDLPLSLMKPMGHGTHGDVSYTIERACTITHTKFCTIPWCVLPDYCPFHQGADQAHTGNLLAFRTIDRTSQKICPWEIKLSLYTQDRLKYSLNTSDSDLIHTHPLEKPTLIEVPVFLVFHSTKSTATAFQMSTVNSLA